MKEAAPGDKLGRTMSGRGLSKSNVRGSHVAQALFAVMLLLLFSAEVAASALGLGPGARRVAIEFPVFIQTKPVVGGVLFDVGRRRIRSDRNGLALIPLARAGVYELSMPSPQQPRPGVRVSFAEWSTGSTRLSDRVTVRTFTYRTVGLNVRRLTSFRFVDEQGNELEPEWIESLTLIDDTGESHVFTGAGPHWLEATRITPDGPGLPLEEVSYSVHSVVVDGVNVAINPGATFRPGGDSPRLIEVATLQSEPSPSPHDSGGAASSDEGEPLTVVVRDALFGFPIGTAVHVRYPDGRSRRLPLQDGARLPLGKVPPGEYILSAEGPGISLATAPDPNSSVVRLSLLSYLDIAALLIAIAAIAGAIMALRSLVRRRRRRKRPARATVPVSPPAAPPPEPPEPVRAPQPPPPPMRAEPEPEPEPVAAEPVAAKPVAKEPQPEPEPESVPTRSGPVPVAEPEPEREPVARQPEPERVAEQQEPERVAEPEPVAHPEPVAAAPVAELEREPEPVAEKPVADPEPVAGAPVAEPEPVAAPAPPPPVRPPAPPPRPRRSDDPRLVQPRAESTPDEDRVVDLERDSVRPRVVPSARASTEPPAASSGRRAVTPPPPPPKPSGARRPETPGDEGEAEARSIIEDAERHAREERRLIARQREQLIEEMSRRRAQLEERERELTREIAKLEDTLGTLRSQLNVKIATSWLERDDPE
jgi:hypothetical protein